ncbi:MAG TPA: hypothetical protein DCS78_01280, partial [Pseudoalteromonas shioyasakiensis]|nr:hypothetical protein [Pseudoalteromonas shioyasakiensis]
VQILVSQPTTYFPFKFQVSSFKFQVSSFSKVYSVLAQKNGLIFITPLLCLLKINFLRLT